MKKFTKLFLSCAAMAAVTAAVATSAMAAEPTISATYEDANLNGELTLTVTGATGEVTLLVTQTDISKDTVADADILYIDQETDGAFPEKVVLRKTGTEATQYLPDGTYNVYVGYTDGEFKIAKKTFTVGNAGTEIMIGDVNNDTMLDGSDVTSLLRVGVGKSSLGTDAGKKFKVTDAGQCKLVAAGDEITIGDVNKDTMLDGSDVTSLLRVGVGKSSLGTDAGQKISGNYVAE